MTEDLFWKKLPEGSKVSQTLVWGKQSVWLSACRTPAPAGENRAEARTHFEHLTKARESKENLYTCNHSLNRTTDEDQQIEDEQQQTM